MPRRESNGNKEVAKTAIEYDVSPWTQCVINTNCCLRPHIFHSVTILVVMQY